MKLKYNIKLAIFSLIILLLSIYARNMKNDKSTAYFEHEVYYVSIVENTLKSMSYDIKYSTNDEEILEIYNYMRNIQETPTQKSALPVNSDEIIYDFEIVDNVLYIYLMQKINELNPVDRIYFESSLVWTYTGLPYIKEVAFGVMDADNRVSNTNDIYYNDRNNIRINPVIAPEKIITHEITLFFPNIETKNLEKETRSINYNSDKLIASYILEQTIIGPLEKTHTSYIPKSTQINGVKIEDSVCYVDLSGDFIDNNLLIYEQWLSIYSIVYSLVELEEIDAVQFLIDSKKYDTYGNVDLSKPLMKE